MKKKYVLMKHNIYLISGDDHNKLQNAKILSHTLGLGDSTFNYAMIIDYLTDKYTPLYFDIYETPRQDVGHDDFPF